jgi:hypothetical protein
MSEVARFESRAILRDRWLQAVTTDILHMLFN